jgi:hypothetical protein
MSHNSEYNVKNNLPIKERNRTKISHLSFGELMNNRRKFTLNAEAEKTETIQTEYSSIYISQFSCSVAIFPIERAPAPVPNW